MSTIQGRQGIAGVVSTTIRLPRPLRDNLKINAIRAGRSLNTHIVMLLSDKNESPISQDEK